MSRTQDRLAAVVSIVVSSLFIVAMVHGFVERGNWLGIYIAAVCLGPTLANIIALGAWKGTGR